MQNEDPNAFGGPTMTIEDKIELFAELPGDERREVEHYVEAHGEERPHLRDRLREAKRLARLFESARVLGAKPPGEEALAFYAVMQHIDAARRPRQYADAFERLRTQIAATPALQERLLDMERRAAEIADASHAEGQFARLLKASSARAIDGAPAHGPKTDGEDDRSRLSERQASRPHAPRPARRQPAHRSTRRSLRRVGVGVAVLATAYAGLFFVGRVSQPDHERIARFESDELVVEGYENLRGGGTQSATDPVASYIQALRHLREAETSTLGLFPRFRDDRLDSAAVLLREVLENEPEDSFLATEAQYFLGKTELARGNLADARTLLTQVANTPGVRAPDARNLLEHTSDL